ncbi:MAG: Wzz/FepE/Etk N-terminal domain-containing protein [Bacillota bacterium]|nr:Wzz/FepE/Etk N-terminal domain-containing protein [Bacillota bacterium]
MNYERILRLIIKKLWLVILLPVLTGSLGAYYSFNVVKPIYEANTTLYIVSKNVDTSALRAQYSDNLVTLEMVKDYEELMKSDAIISKVIDELKLNCQPEDLAQQLSVGSKHDTRIMEITVQHNNPKTARDIANKLAEVFMREAERLIRVENIDVVDQAKLPKKPINSKSFKYILLALIAGLATALGIIFGLEYLNNKIRLPEDIEKKFNLPVLGNIPDLDI